MIKLKKLEGGDRIALIAPSGTLITPKEFGCTKKAIGLFEKLNLKLHPMKYSKIRGEEFDYSTMPDNRILDLNYAIRDPSMNAIYCIEGGFFSYQMVTEMNKSLRNRIKKGIATEIDYECFKNNPKPFLGFCDNTSLTQTLYAKTGVPTFQCLVLTSIYEASENKKEQEVKSEEHAKNWEKHFTNLLIEGKPIDIKAEPLRKGSAKGTFVGGNLFTFVKHTPDEFCNLDDKILLIEEAGEDLDLVKSLIQGIKKKPYADKLSAVVAGQFIHPNYFRKNFDKKEIEKYENEVKDYLAGNFSCPVLWNIPFGHYHMDCHTLPIGVKAEVEGNSLRIDSPFE
ncbi:MAG: LD-carboxypeptidase [bacterium]